MFGEVVTCVRLIKLCPVLYAMLGVSTEIFEPVNSVWFSLGCGDASQSLFDWAKAADPPLKFRTPTLRLSLMLPWFLADSASCAKNSLSIRSTVATSVKQTDASLLF